jgi:hypothetical protein
MNKFVIVSIVTDVFLIMCQIFVNATGLWTLLGNNHDLMIMQSWFDENAMKQLTFLTLDYICISRSGTPSRYTEIHFVNNCLSKKRNRPQKRPPNAKSSNANEVPPHSFMLQINHCNTGYSIPAMEDRMVRTRGARYVSYQQSVSMIWPQCSRRNTDKRFVKPKSNWIEFNFEPKVLPFTNNITMMKGFMLYHM